MDVDLQVYELRFAEPAALHRAFDSVSAHPEVASCSFEPAAGRILLMARRPVGEALVERIYQEGGLAWCSRHVLERPLPA